MKKELEFLINQGEGYNLEFKESSTDNLAKDICAFANATGGKILIGVTDNGTIRGIKTTNKLRSQLHDLTRNMDPPLSISLRPVDNILIITVPEGTKKPYSVNGRFYLREGSNSNQLKRDEIRAFFVDEGIIKFDEQPNKKFNFTKHFDDEKFHTFLEKAQITPIISKENILENLQLLDKEYLKNAGVLFFCKTITPFIISATIKCVLFRGKTKYKILSRKEFDEDIYTNYQQAMTFLEANLRTEYIITGAGPREEKLEFPEDALREAVLNAIAHRDYTSTASIHVEIYEDRVEIHNPGGLIGNLTVKDLYTRSIPRNPLLFGLMQRMELVEKVGSGLLRINKAMKSYHLPPPKIDADKNFFKITFLRPDLQRETIEERTKKIESFGEKMGRKWGEKLGQNEEKILQIISQNKYVTIAQIASSLKIATTTVENNLEKLKNKGLLRRIGPDKGGYWEVNQ